MSRSLFLIVAVVAFAGFVAAELDASDLLFKTVTEQPEAVMPQRALLSSRGLAAVYPPKKMPCVKSSTPVFAKYWLTLTTYNTLVKNYAQIADEFADYYLNKWPSLFDLPDVTPFQNKPLLKKGPVFSTYRIVIRVYLTPLNIEKCPISARQVAYQAHIFKRALSKINDFKSKKVWKKTVTKV